MALEMNMDGLVGPTHNYAGLSFGNIASDANRGLTSSPRKAALQGLSKMRKLIELGVPQGVLPPHERPYIPALHRLGFTGSDAEILAKAAQNAPQLLSIVSSASNMWSANAATVSPSTDSLDQKVHLTPANLVSMPHRSFEAPTTTRILRKVFSNHNHFVVHDPLPASELFGDEGAANHNRMSFDHGSKGLEIFVYGRSASDNSSGMTRFPARQTLEASNAVARLHKIEKSQSLFLRQNSSAIEGGAFHNDVVCVSNGPVLLFHELAFAEPELVKNEIRQAAAPIGFEPVFVMATEQELNLREAIKSYIFNSQIVSLNKDRMAFILPSDAEESSATKAFVDACIAGSNPISEAHYLDLRQSMRNGGGPACLRLRVQLNEEELKAVHGPVRLTASMCERLETWVRTHYREELAPNDIADPNLLAESRTALDELTQLLELGSIYEFQMT